MSEAPQVWELEASTLVGNLSEFQDRAAPVAGSASRSSAARVSSLRVVAPGASAASVGSGGGAAVSVRPGAARFFEMQLVDLRARGFPENDILVTECIARRDLHRRKLG